MTSKEALEILFSSNNYNGNYHDLIEAREQIEEDLEILDILRKRLYVAPELVELKMTNKEYAIIHNVKYHNAIPIVADLKTFNKINDWFYKRGGRK